MTTDPIADMLTRIRNAAAVSKSTVTVPYSKIKHHIADILVNSGFIAGASVDKSGVFKSIILELNSPSAAQQITTLERVSKPGRRIYAKSTDLPQVLSGRGIVIVSTSGGLMTGSEARKKGLGGELICKVY